ncbi:MAG TPA: hypothetical protein PKD48_02105 [Sphingopyxis sp.]|nr:hypothetical protein [Sphingopyxis sp.]
MPTDATPEQVAMARSVFADMRGWGKGSPFWDDLRASLADGVFDREEIVQSALRAIQETTRLAADLGHERAEAYIGHNMVEFGEAHTEYANALTEGDHLKGHPND